MHGGPEGNYYLSRYLASTWVPMGAIYYAETRGCNCLDQQMISVCHQGFCSQKEQMASSKYLRTAYEELCVER